MASGWLKRKDRIATYWRFSESKVTVVPMPVCTYCEKVCKPATVKGMTRAEQVEYMRANYADFATIDHILSRSTHPHLLLDANNHLVACNACNSSKKDTPLKEWCEKTERDYDAIVARIAQYSTLDIAA